MLKDPFEQPARTQRRKYLQPYDIAASRSADNLLGGIRQARNASVFGAGGLSGDALGRQIAAEGRYEAGAQDIQMRREAQERARLQREAELRARMRGQVVGNYMGAVGNLSAALGAGIIGAVQRGDGDGGSSPSGVGTSYGIPSGNFTLAGAGQRRF